MRRRAGLLPQPGRQLTRRCGLTLHEADHCYAGECQRREPAAVIWICVVSTTPQLRLTLSLSLQEKSISIESGELEENVTSPDALYATTSCWGGVKRLPKTIP